MDRPSPHSPLPLPRPAMIAYRQKPSLSTSLERVIDVVQVLAFATDQRILLSQYRTLCVKLIEWSVPNQCGEAIQSSPKSQALVGR